MLIGIVGFISSGKGTVGEILKARGFNKVAFADSVKDVCAIIYGWPRELLEGDTTVSRQWRETPDKYWTNVFGYDYTPRMALYDIGTICVRNTLNKDIWIHSLILKKHLSNTVITDVRHQNEIKFIRDNGGILLRVRRGEDPNWMSDLSNLSPEDPIRHSIKMAIAMEYGINESETDWVGTEFDYVIENNGELSDLIVEVDKFLELHYNANTSILTNEV